VSIIALHYPATVLHHCLHGALTDHFLILSFEQVAVVFPGPALSADETHVFFLFLTLGGRQENRRYTVP